MLKDYSHQFIDWVQKISNVSYVLASVLFAIDLCRGMLTGDSLLALANNRDRLTLKGTVDH